MPPVIARNNCVCTLCKLAVGSEYHAMFKCLNPQLLALRTKYVESICQTKSQLSEFDDKKSLFIYFPVKIRTSILWCAIGSNK